MSLHRTIQQKWDSHVWVPTPSSKPSELSRIDMEMRRPPDPSRTSMRVMARAADLLKRAGFEYLADDLPTSMVQVGDELSQSLEGIKTANWRRGAIA
eukprot:615191-Amorphochlora_amoeboformis.AAC.1